jgi:hypothetical protein
MFVLLGAAGAAVVAVVLTLDPIVGGESTEDAGGPDVGVLVSVDVREECYWLPCLRGLK